MVATSILLLGLAAMGQERITIINSTADERIGIYIRCSDHGTTPRRGWVFLNPGEEKVFSGHRGYFKVGLLNGNNVEIRLVQQILINERGSEAFHITKYATAPVGPDGRPMSKIYYRLISNDEMQAK